MNNFNNYIVKKDGIKEAFDEEKIRKSLINAGASRDFTESIIKMVRDKLKNMMPSKEIYKIIRTYLRRKKPDIALRYKLKRAIMDLGPTGYIFEKYIAKILTEYGYNTEVGEIVSGYCVDHEVDVIAEKDNAHYMIECKYHNNLDTSSDIKTALYVHSRFQDIKKACMEKGNGYNLKEGWLITNTKVTSEVIKYTRCVEMKVVAWHYPEEKNLEYYIENKRLYPISILDGLNNQQKNILYDNGIITVKDLINYGVENTGKLLKAKPVDVNKLFLQARMLTN